VVRDLLNPGSLLNECVKVVVLFNITDDNINIPDDLVIEFGGGIENSFPSHRLVRYVMLVKAKTVQREVVERFVPANKQNIFFFIWNGSREQIPIVYLNTN
jgi:hypothetical protein